MVLTQSVLTKLADNLKLYYRKKSINKYTTENKAISGQLQYKVGSIFHFEVDHKNALISFEAINLF